MSGTPSLASQIAGVLTCFEAIVDALIARDPAMAIAIEERLEEAVALLEQRSDLDPKSAVPPRSLLRILRMRREGAQQES